MFYKEYHEKMTVDTDKRMTEECDCVVKQRFFLRNEMLESFLGT